MSDAPTPYPVHGAFTRDGAFAFLDRAVIPMRLATMSRDGAPIVTSLWFTRREDHLYCAVPGQSKIAARLRQDPRCGFEIAADAPPYRGVRGQGHATVRPHEGAAVLETLMTRYLGDRPSTLRSYLQTRGEHEVAICVRPSWLRGWDYSDRMWDIAAPPEE